MARCRYGSVLRRDVLISQQESSFRYAVPNPNTKLSYRSNILAILTLGYSLAILWLTGIGIPRFLLIGAIVCAVFMVVTLPVIQFLHKRSEVVIMPSCLVIRHWKESRHIPWDDVDSVTLDKYEAANPIDRLLRGKSAPRVKLSLRRLHFPPGRSGPRIVPLYLQDGEGFVRQAQQHLVS